MTLEGILIGLLAVGVGLAWAFFGLRLFIILLPLWAGLMGLLVGASWGQELLGEGFFGTVTSWVIGIVLGLVLAVISYFWYYFAVTLAAGTLGYMLGVGLMDFLNLGDGILAIIVGLVVGAVFAAFTFLAGVPAFLVIFVSAAGGAAAVVNGVLIFLGRINVDDLQTGIVGGLLTDTLIGIVLWVVVAVLGIAYQLRDVGRTMTTIEREGYRY